MGRVLLFVGAVLLMSTQGAAARCVEEDAMGSDTLRGYVQGIQTALADHGFKPGPADGKTGPRTRSAIKTYQKKAKLAADGCVSQALIDHLNFAEPKVYAR